MTNKDPLLSFIVPVYKKRPEVLDNCLKSLRDMSYKRIEIIVVFDGPPEDVELSSIARKYTGTDKIFQIEHGGAPKARNYGFTKSVGDYVSFWDCDSFAKPEMARRWMEEFKSTEADFVYSGYEFTGHSGAINGEPFDPYLLTCNNYISTMFPMRRGVFPGFDETLKAGQDWDLWLSIVEKGGKGSYIEGYGFSTESSDQNSITAQEWNDKKFRETHWKVRNKHGIPKRDIVIGSSMEKLKGLHIAKLIEADFSQFLDFRVHDYRLAFNLGFGENIWFQNAPSNCVKIQYWMPWDITGLENWGFLKSVGMLNKLSAMKMKHWVNDMVSQKRLGLLFKYVGLPDPEIVPLPSEIDEAEKTLPKDYRVLLDVDDAYMPILKSIKQDLPYIAIDDLHFQRNPIVEIKNYSLLVSFKQYPTVDEPIRRMLINGRNVISNTQAPYTGYFDLDVSMKDFKQTLIRRIRDARVLKFNKEASDYYKKQVDPKAFAKKIASFMPAKLEVL